ncbi:Phenylacetate-coenzyme A ligase [subsurface metagenome]
MDEAYWDKEIETIDRHSLQQLQLERLKKTLERASKSQYYKRRIPATINNLTALKDIPFTTKSDLRNSFPEGMLAVSRDEIVRLHASSGELI